MIAQGDVWWADLGEPNGSEPGYRRPVVVIQCDAFNRSRIATVVCVPLTSDLRWSRAPGNVFLATAATGLPKDSVANVAQLVALDRGTLVERLARLPDREFGLVLAGIDVVLGRWHRDSRMADHGPTARPMPYDGRLMSWDEAFSERYDEWAADMTADVPFYVGLAREADGPIVELAVGTGRVAIPVALATGRRVIGVDASPGMLRQARANAAKAGVDLTLIEGDMRDLALDEPAALIYCPFRALLHLRTWADRRRVFERVAASLRPGGRFAWNAFAFSHHAAMRHDGVRQEDPVPHTVRYAVGDNRIDLVLDGGGTSSLWWATKNEWLGLLDVAGLQLEVLCGGFDGEPLTDDSLEYVFVARR